MKTKSINSARVVAKQKAKAVSVSADTTDLNARRAERAVENAKLIRVTPQLPPPLPAAAYVKQAAYNAAVDEALKSIHAGGISAPLREALTAKVVAIQSKPADAEQLAPAQSVSIPVNLLKAAIAVTSKKDVRHALQGVHIHQTANGQTRIAATDGHRLLVSNVPNIAPIEWAMGDGVILNAVELNKIVRYYGKDKATLEISHGAKHPHVIISAAGDLATFKIAPTSYTKFPDYQRIIDESAEAFTSEHTEFETSCFKPEYLKSAGAIAEVLEAKGVLPYIGGDSKRVAVFGFAGVAQTILYIAPQNGTECLPAASVKLYGADAINRQITVLLENIKRSENNAKTTKRPKFAQCSRDRAARLKLRVEQLRAAISVKLEAPKAKAPETVKADPIVAAAVATARAVTTASVH